MLQAGFWNKKILQNYLTPPVKFNADLFLFYQNELNKFFNISQHETCHMTVNCFVSLTHTIERCLRGEQM